MKRRLVAGSFGPGQKLFVTRRWCLSDSFAIPGAGAGEAGKKLEILGFGFPMPVFCAPLTSLRNTICRKGGAPL
jgi:hypothetical protein